MSIESRPNGINFAIIVPFAIRKDSDSVECLAGIISTSDEMTDKAIEIIQEGAGSAVLRLDSHQVRMERNRFAFSAKQWHAPWQPKGPKPNWRTDEGIPIQ